MNKTLSWIIAIVVLLIGAFYALMPHSTHISSGLDFGLSHGIHITIGIILLLIGAFLIWKSVK